MLNRYRLLGFIFDNQRNDNFRFRAPDKQNQVLGFDRAFRSYCTFFFCSDSSLYTVGELPTLIHILNDGATLIVIVSTDDVKITICHLKALFSLISWLYMYGYDRKTRRKLYRESTCKRFNLDTVLSEKSWMLSSDFPLNIVNLKIYHFWPAVFL